MRCDTRTNSANVCSSYNEFGFQLHSMQNMYDRLMAMLDSRASRMSSLVALQSLHADYIGEPDANYEQCDENQNTDIPNDSQEAWQDSMEHMSNMAQAFCFIFKCANYAYKPNTTVVAPEAELLGRGIKMLNLQDKRKLMDVPQEERYYFLRDICWTEGFTKTFKEKRSCMHLAVNFTRVWYYISANASALYLSEDKNEAENEVPVLLSIVAHRSSTATLIVLIACLVEYIGISLAISVIQLFISIATSLFFIIVPQTQLFVKKSKKQDKRRAEAYKTFTANFPHLKRMDRATSIGLWVCVFGCKFLESYAFLVLSFKDPVTAMASMRIEDCNDVIIGSSSCSYMPLVALVLMIIMDLVLFFLDTYLWYIVWNTMFSVARSFYLGISIWTPLRNMYSRLPKRIYAKILAVSELDIQCKSRVLCSQVWNTFVIAMYRDHLLSADHVEKLLYQQVKNISNKQKTSLEEPTFFVAQEDIAYETEYSPQQSEAERRMRFFAQSLTTPMSEPLPVPSMPTFTVLTPHYNEKILLTLREIIQEENQNTRIALLEYLKRLHPFEWKNFVKDTKILADEAIDTPLDAVGDSLVNEKGRSVTDSAPTRVHKDTDDLPFYCMGFKSSAPEYTLRTRIWASLRTQTLYRTVTGFMNYGKAIKLLYRVEQPGLFTDEKMAEYELDQMAHRKFRLVLAMQRYADFSKEERENVEVLLKEYPNLQIAYIEIVEGNDTEEQRDAYYSVLIDSHCSTLADGTRSPKYRIRLPGNPILGDGKSDNQNHTLIFYCGEYLQLIDANQDNYLEECLKIRNVLAEFEQKTHSNHQSSYRSETNSNGSPVAIVGVQEYIFSENIGVLGDIAAGKEQTFGTLSQRIMATIGGRLHYGHPDFLNGIFMTIRGGVRKAQKGLYLNEDIYAGMNAFERGGCIKHVEYYQCGKGRDLGMGSILNFITKIALDRFLTFYYAHPGFHINNIFIMLSVQLFMVVTLVIGALAMPVTLCEFNPDVPKDAPLEPEGCYNLVPVFDWLKRVVISIFVIFAISFLPLFLQELYERGFLRACSSYKAIIIFVTQCYADSILSNLSYGGARYIATGRGFATSRIPFSQLFSRFADSSTYFGARSFLNASLWFSLIDFFVDYREYLRWLSRGNGASHSISWIGFSWFKRTKVTGVKCKSGKIDNPQPRAKLAVVFFTEIVVPVCIACICTIAYLFVHSILDEEKHTKSGVLIRIAALSLGPIVLNAAVLGGLLGFSILASPLASFYWRFDRTLLGVITITPVQRVIIKAVTILLAREFNEGESNEAWWTGRWCSYGLGHYIMLILFLVCLIPGSDKWHSLMLFWLQPSKQIRNPVRIAILYGILFIVACILLLAILIIPAALGPHLDFLKHLTLPLV
ncbi:1,3-beta-glucan synthase component-domain-containing protein [Phascolomyces articulosus]|uniref:1,3-beta-glucan synthase component-domain-containing protein n=1 Tax=Phascolomyces articulosus TaxID=60185 RepID=A0AAD5JXL8_9FUNG|nr:1,3-beta-glucan synthase component-domain-containing protein [Phascolomyces articulosus]